MALPDYLLHLVLILALSVCYICALECISKHAGFSSQLTSQSLWAAIAIPLSIASARNLLTNRSTFHAGRSEEEVQKQVFHRSINCTDGNKVKTGNFGTWAESVSQAPLFKRPGDEATDLLASYFSPLGESSKASSPSLFHTQGGAHAFIIVASSYSYSISESW